MSNCVVCWYEKNADEYAVEVSNEYILKEWNVCKNHKEKLTMQCSVCGSQDTKYVTGISKTGKNAGKPWAAYDCNESQCKNEKGYASRTFVQMPKAKSQAIQSGVSSTLEKKVDKILAILEANFKPLVTKSIEKANEELQIESEETPF